MTTLHRLYKTVYGMPLRKKADIKLQGTRRFRSGLERWPRERLCVRIPAATDLSSKNRQ